MVCYQDANFRGVDVAILSDVVSTMKGDINDIVNQFNLVLEIDRNDVKCDEVLSVIDDDLLAIAGLIEKVRAVAKDMHDGDFVEEVDEYLKDLL